MRQRDQKTVLTKAIIQLLKTTTSIRSLEGVTPIDKHAVKYKFIITPGSPSLIGYFTVNRGAGEEQYADRLSVTRFSDYIVRNNQFEFILATVKPEKVLT